MNALTRAQAKSLEEKQQRDEELSAQDQAQPVPITITQGTQQATREGGVLSP